MEKEELDEILVILNNLYDVDIEEELQPILDKLCEQTGKTPISIEEMPIEESDVEETILKLFVPAIEQLLQPEEKEYFYDNLDIDYIAYVESEEKKLEILQNDAIREFRKVGIINSLGEEKRVEWIDKLVQEENKKQVILTLEEQKRIENLEKLADEADRIEVILSLSKNTLLQSFSSNDTLRQKYSDILQKCKLIYQICDKSDSITEEDEKKYETFDLPKNMKIGAEIEAEAEEELSKILKLHIKQIDNWSFKEEETIENGIEATSNIMYDTSEDINGIYKTTKILKELGFSISPRCGGHVHIGADYLQTAEEYKELLEIWGNAEKIFYYISNPPGELPREGASKFAPPISIKLQGSNLEKQKTQRLEEFIEEAQRIQEAEKMADGRKWSSLNLININNQEKNTIEFRISNGSLDPDIWIENIRLYGKTVQMAHELVQINLKSKQGQKLTEKEKQKLQAKEALKSEEADDKKMEALMQLLFDNQQQRAIYQKRFNANKALDKEERRVENLKFGKVDFKNIYESVKIPNHLIEDLKDRKENKISIIEGKEQ